MSDILVPSLGESVSEATVAKWFKKPGDAVAKDELLVELETDKVTLEVNALVSGALKDIKAKEGDSVKMGQVLGSITEGAAGASSSGGGKKTAKEEAPKPAPATVSGLEGAGPAARKIVNENALDPSSIPGSGKGGRITKGDVLQMLPPALPANHDLRATRSGERGASSPAPAGPRENRVKMSKLRQAIARRLKESQNTAAILTTFNEIDMSGVITLRNQYKDEFEKKHGVKLGFMSFFTKAAIAALKELPAVNAGIDGDEIVYKNYYDIGIAVGSPQGLVVPVLRDADRLSFSGIEKEINDYGKKARDGKLAMSDLQGGTFTISNGGVFGSLLSTPIINPPQSGILGLHKTEERPVAANGQVVIRPMMYVALSYDHRIIDGREAVTFLVRVKEAIENPSRLLLEV